MYFVYTEFKRKPTTVLVLLYYILFNHENLKKKRKDHIQGHILFAFALYFSIEVVSEYI